MYETSPRGRFRTLKKEAKKRGYAFDPTLEQWKAIVALPCAYGAHSQTTSQTGVDRRDNSAGYTVENSVPCCGRHNFIKSEVFTFEEMLHIVEHCPSAQECGLNRNAVTPPIIPI